MDPVTHKDYTVAQKCYKNLEFLNSADARYLRILCEYEVRPALRCLHGLSHINNAVWTFLLLL